jgi:hypothetical protein
VPHYQVESQAIVLSGDKIGKKSEIWKVILFQSLMKQFEQDAAWYGQRKWRKMQQSGQGTLNDTYYKLLKKMYQFQNHF